MTRASRTRRRGTRRLPLRSVGDHAMDVPGGHRLLAAYIFLRGHDAPGGGFAAGVAMAAGFILQYMAAGTRWVEDRLRILPVVWISAGLLLAALPGSLSWLLGDPFLTSYFAVRGDSSCRRRAVGERNWCSTSASSVLVVGATVLMLVALAHQSVRQPARAAALGGAASRGAPLWN